VRELLRLAKTTDNIMIIFALAVHHSWCVREYVACNSNCSKDLLQRLMKDESWHVREAARKNLEKGIFCDEN